MRKLDAGTFRVSPETAGTSSGGRCPPGARLATFGEQGWGQEGGQACRLTACMCVCSPPRFFLSEWVSSVLPAWTEAGTLLGLAVRGQAALWWH